MAQSPELRTSLKQRIGIIIVAIIMVGSTIALYMGIVMNYDKSSSATTSKSEKEDRFGELYSQHQTEVDTFAGVLSSSYFEQFIAHKDRVKSFNAAAITSVTTVDLKEGDGEEITEGSSNYSAYYIGWISDETIFDSSLDSTTDPTSLKFPLAGGSMIEGWNQGIIGMKIGGIREISIPAELAYGDEERGSIPANSPLKFIVMLVPRTEEPEWSDEMNQLYEELYGGNAY